MKHMLRSGMAFVAVVLTATAAMAQPPADAAADRAAAIKHLESTRAAFLKSIEGVTEAQWSYKAGPDRWSIAQVAEHIAISEGTILGMITTKMLQAPPPTGTRVDDEKVIATVTDRTQKFQAPEILQPAGKWASREALAKDFDAARDKTIEWVKTTKEDLRGHASPHPALGPIDVHQWVLLLSAHTARHTAQIEEVKQSAAFPK